MGLELSFKPIFFVSLDDLKALDSNKLNLRICKGIYNESKEISFKSKKDINKNFLSNFQNTYLKKGYACLATHDLELINSIEDFIQLNKIE